MTKLEELKAALDAAKDARNAAAADWAAALDDAEYAKAAAADWAASADWAAAWDAYYKELGKQNDKT